jgi:cation diffusion facilitator family transporter
MHEGSRRAIVAAFLANLGIAVSKLAVFAVTGAASLLAESIHSLADTGNQGLLFLGGTRSRREATEAHPFGFGRERFFWAFVVALVLFSVGSLFAVYEGIQKVIDPHALESPELAFGVLGVAVALESFSLHTAVREASKVRGPGSWWSFIHASKNPELPVVLLEDCAALAGLLFALLGVAAATVTGDPVYDAIGSIAIGLLLGVVAVVLAIEMKSLLIGESASPEMQRAIHDAIVNGPEVDRLIHLRTEHLGPEDLLVAAKIELSPTADRQVARSIDRVEARIRGRVPQARVIYLEPDEFRGEHDPY